MAFLVMTDVQKRFGGVRALQGASLEVDAGEVHGLLGPNGSGKSTLNKVLTGMVRPDRATVTIDGHEAAIGSPRDAHALGVAAVYQQLSVIPHLTVAQNLVLGVESARGGFLRDGGAVEGVDEVFEWIRPGLSPRVTPDTPVARLAPGERQLLEFAKAALRRPQILVLDEATASLRSDQVGLVFTRTRALAEAGTAVVFVSHRMDEIRELCHRATILRGGRTITTVTMSQTSDDELVHLMVGDVATSDVARAAEVAEERRPEPDRSGPPLLAVTGLTGPHLHDVDLAVHPGEIVGLGGLQGQGQSDLLHALFGASPAVSGRIMIGGREVHPRRPRDAMSAGVAFVPGDRDSQGLMSKRSILENLSVASLRERLAGGFWVRMPRERASAAEQVERLAIKIGSLSDDVSTLSGGNQQKVVLGKWLVTQPRIVLLDDPTKGVDVGAKQEIYRIVREMTAQGAVVLLNSSDDEELVELCDRVLVMFEGRIRTELVGDRITPSSLVEAALAGSSAPSSVPPTRATSSADPDSSKEVAR